jgi:hypothetical protein
MKNLLKVFLIYFVLSSCFTILRSADQYIGTEWEEIEHIIFDGQNNQVKKRLILHSN